MAPGNDQDALKSREHCDFKHAFASELRALGKDQGDDKSLLAGLAFSGGGIRSATFNLGVLQALARLGILKKFDYLSTVSGGGYIGSWLTAWIRRECTAMEAKAARPPAPLDPDNAAPAPTEQAQPSTQPTQESLDKVIAALNPGSANPSAQGPAFTQQGPEAKPISHLREFSNYLTPRRGWWSNDTWTLAVAYLRNFTLTFSVLLGALVATILLVHGLATLYSAALTTSSDTVRWIVFGAFGVALFFTTFFCAWDLGVCRALAERERTQAGDSLNLTYFAIGCALFCAWLGVAGLWHIHISFFENIFKPVTLIALAATIAAVAIGGWTGSKTAQCKCKSDPACAVANKTTQGKQADTSQPRRVLAAAIACGGLILTICLLQYWIGKWPVDVNWLGAGHWLVVAWGALLSVFAFSIFAAVFIGVAENALDELEREWLARFFAAVTKWAGLLCLLNALVLYAPIAVQWLGLRLHGFPNGVLGLLWAGISAGGAILGHSGGKDPSDESRRWITRVVMAVAPVIFMIGLIVIVSWALNNWFAAFLNTSDTQPVYWKVLPLVTWQALLVCAIAGLGIAGLTWAWSSCVGVNTFSLHALYGNRLVRAYLGASNLQRRAHAFIGFDPTDNEIRLSDLRPKSKRYQGPLLIINAAINLVHGNRLAWQQRKAGAFTFTPLYCGYEFAADADADEGAACGGYVPSSRYADGGSGKGISLGRAMTISGAAASPNMGYHSSPALAFLMTVFNVRLGWWLPNTGVRDKKLWSRRGPKSGLIFLWRELLGLTDAKGNFVYISDGGHFENLGIYELVRRRCRYIVVCDAEDDAKMQFGGLGNAIERCRTDFGIPIDINVAQLRRDPATGLSRWHCAIGKIQYSNVDAKARDGILLYIKAALTSDEPRDVATYAARKPAFPHESTADQWFDEAQFESYRALGQHIVEEVMDTAARVAREEQEELAIRRNAQRPAATQAHTQEMERLFLELRKKWYPRSASETDPRADHDAALAGILDAMRADPQLAFLDWQIYPDIGGTVRGARLPHRTTPWVPLSYAELRAGFFFCKRLLHFMQQLFHDRELDTMHNAPSNRGWMNLLRRWSSARMLRYTWSLAAGTYSARFQTFCEHHLALEVGPLSWTGPLCVQKGQPLLSEKTTEADQWHAAERQYGLDFFEGLIIQQFLRLFLQNNSALEKDALFKIYPLRIASEDPTSADAGKCARITAGFAIIGPESDGRQQTQKVLFVRIRPCMRCMGLFRQALDSIPADDGGQRYPIAFLKDKFDFTALEEDKATWRHRIYREIFTLKSNQPHFLWLQALNREVVATEESS